MTRSFVVNASPLILLVRVGRLDLLSDLAEKVAVPNEVMKELRAGAHRDEAANVVESAGWIQVASDVSVPAEILTWDLGGGESQVLSYALENKECDAVLDDRAGRRCAEAVGVPVIGTMGVVLAAKRKSIIQRARPVIESLRSHGMFVKDDVMNAALAEVEE